MRIFDDGDIVTDRQELQALAFEMVATRKDAPAAAEILSEFIHMLTSKEEDDTAGLEPFSSLLDE
nr:MAG TPA: hypothetical protein [Caudoviricetes sp.]